MWHRLQKELRRQEEISGIWGKHRWSWCYRGSRNRDPEFSSYGLHYCPGQINPSKNSFYLVFDWTQSLQLPALPWSASKFPSFKSIIAPLRHFLCSPVHCRAPLCPHPGFKVKSSNILSSFHIPMVCLSKKQHKKDNESCLHYQRQSEMESWSYHENFNNFTDNRFSKKYWNIPPVL